MYEPEIKCKQILHQKSAFLTSNDLMHAACPTGAQPGLEAGSCKPLVEGGPAAPAIGICRGLKMLEAKMARRLAWRLKVRHFSGDSLFAREAIIFYLS
jgi:hypothetical protein